MGVNNSFAPFSDKQNQFTRRWAGTGEDAVDPFISGYFFIHFSYLPSQLPDAVGAAGGADGLNSKSQIRSVLHSTCMAVTIPGATVNKTEITGLGGIKWAAPTNVDWDNTITLKFLEFSGLPIHSIIHGWVRLIRDYRTGVSQLEGENYAKSEYAGTMYYWTTKPDGKTVEYAACASGMFPMKDPTDLLSGDITAYDKVEVDIDFNVDYLWHEQWVKTKCQTYANEYFDAGTGTVNETYGSGSGDGQEN